MRFTVTVQPFGFPVTLGCQILSISLNLLELCAKVKGIKRREI